MSGPDRAHSLVHVLLPNMRLKLAGALALTEAVGSCPGGHGTSSTASCADRSVARSLSPVR